MNYDPYKMLGVTEPFTIDDLKSKFRELSLQTHPDKGGDEELFKILKDSYNYVLKKKIIE